MVGHSRGWLRYFGAAKSAIKTTKSTRPAHYFWMCPANPPTMPSRPKPLTRGPFLIKLAARRVES